jgi:acyl-CoA thioester hydrolase
MSRHTAKVRVRFAETDQMGVVYHSNYLIWMEVGRVELCRSLGIRYRDMEKEDGVLLAVAEATCRYLTPARYDDEVEIVTWIETAHPRMVVFAYEMRHAETGAVLAKGQTKHIFCGPDLKPARLPAKYWPNFSIQRAG